jgi:hypothetical protein
MHSIKPLKPEFLRISKSNPDLYGPFWIMTTIVVLASLSGNLSRYFRNWDQSEFEFRMELVRYAVFVLYGYGVLFAGAVGVILNFFGSQLTPINVSESLTTDYMPLRIFSQYFSGDLFIMHYSQSCTTLAANCIWDAELDCLDISQFAWRS